METLFAWLVGLSVLINLSGYAPYALDILQKKAEPPKKVSWLVWTLLDIIIFVGMLTKGKFSWPLVGYIIGSAVITALAFKFGEKGWSKMDKICLSLGLASLAISFFTENANYAILICSAAVPIGGIPVLQGLWEKGHKDSILPWVLFFIGGFLGLFNIKSAEVKEFAMPVTFSAFQTITLIVVIVARLKSRR